MAYLSRPDGKAREGAAMQQESSVITERNLTIRGDLMFSTVFQDEELCRGLIEITLGMRIAKVEMIVPQRSVWAAPAARTGIVDVLAKDVDGNFFDVEMQNAHLADLPKRARYYGSLMDVAMLNRGNEVVHLKDRAIIFICGSDPFHQDLKRYTCRMACRENGMLVEDGQVTVFVNSRGTKGASTPELDAWLAYLDNGDKIESEYVRRVDDAVRALRRNPVWRRDLMLWEIKYESELAHAKEEASAEGRAEGREQTYRELSQLVQCLEAQGRGDEVLRAISDADLRERLLNEFGIG